MSNRRKTRAERPTAPVSRAQAVKDITAHIVDRDAFVIGVPPALIPSAAHRLAKLTRCTWYADNGTGIVMRLAAKSLPVIEAVEMLLPGMTAAVAVVPKTVPAARLAKLLGNPAIPDDGSRDLLMLHDDDAAVQWPALLVEALAAADPEFVARLAANDPRGLS